MKPEVAPLYGYAAEAIRASLAKRRAPVPAEPEAPREELTEEDKQLLSQHYQSVK